MKSYTVLCLIILFVSCSTPEKRDSLKPDSVGKLSELVILSDSYDEEYKKTINQVFKRKLDGFPPPG